MFYLNELDPLLKLNLAIFILFLGLFSGIYAMEEEQPNQQIINLKLSDGQNGKFSCRSCPAFIFDSYLSRR